MTTVVTASPLAHYARVLVLKESVNRFLPSATFLWIITDPPSEGRDLAGAPEWTLTCRDLATTDFDGVDSSMPHPEFWAATGLLHCMATSDNRTLLYLGPKTVVFSRLVDAFSGLRTFSVLLTPKILTPDPGSEAPGHELHSLSTGVYSASLLALKNDAVASRFLLWWRDRLFLNSPFSDSNGSISPEAWLSLAPAYFSNIAVIRYPNAYVAATNLHERRIDGNFEDGFHVAGRALGVFDFAGYCDGTLAHAIHDHANLPSVRMIAAWYDQRVRHVSPRAPRPSTIFTDESSSEGGPRPQARNAASGAVV